MPSSRTLAKDIYLNPDKILQTISNLTKKTSILDTKSYLKKIYTRTTDIPYKDFKDHF